MNSLRLILPEMCLLFIFSMALVFMSTLYHGQLTFLQGTFVLPLIALACLVFSALIPPWRRHLSAFLAGRRLTYIFRDWMPLIALAFVYENLHEYLTLFSANTLDGALRSIDQHIFGVDLTLWMERFNTPWLTEFMTFAYALYFVFPTYLLLRIYLRGYTVEFRELSIAIAICFYISFLGYIAVPAVGPRYFIPNEFLAPLQGYWLTPRAADVWNSLEKVKTDCFPSQHTALSLLSLIYFWRFRNLYHGGRLAFWVSFPLIMALWISTLYLRYHWGIDVIAGALLAFACAWGAHTFSRWYFYRRNNAAAKVLRSDVA